MGCASSGVEEVDKVFTELEVPVSVTIIPSNGSRIHPDSHALAFCFAISVGSIVCRLGSGQTPEVGSDPHLYSDENVHPGGRQVSGDLVRAWSELDEMCILAAPANAEADSGVGAGGGPPIVALGDGSPIIRLCRASIPDRQRVEMLGDYCSASTSRSVLGRTWLPFSAGPWH